MSRSAEFPFDEALLSGYLDGELTQGEAQRVRLYLEDNPEARRVMDDLRHVRQVSLSTPVPVPTDDQWDERPRGLLSRLFRDVGWGVILTWAAVVAGLAVWGLARSPGAWWEKALAVAFVGGPLLLFLSVLVDRLKTAGADRYRRIVK